MDGFSTNNNIEDRNINTHYQPDYAISNQDKTQLRQYLGNLGGYETYASSTTQLPHPSVSRKYEQQPNQLNSRNRNYVNSNFALSKNVASNSPLNIHQRTIATQEFIYPPIPNRVNRQNSVNKTVRHQRSESLNMATSPTNTQLFSDRNFAPYGWSTEIVNSNVSDSIINDAFPDQLYTSSSTNVLNTNVSSNIDPSISSLISAPPGWQTERISNHSTGSRNYINTTNEVLHPPVITTTNVVTSPTATTSWRTDNIRSTNGLSLPTSSQYYSNVVDQRQSRLRSFSADSHRSSSPWNTINSTQAPLITSSSHSSIRNLVHSQQPPLIIRKHLPNDLVTYKQNVSVRFLKPPTPPPPGPVIIREVRPPPPRPQSPIRYRQRPPPPPTPPPLFLREAPPPIPPRLPTQVVEKIIPPPPRPPPRIIVERLGALPAKPRDVVIERWLPYRQNRNRKIFYERDSVPYNIIREPNELILHASPHARIHRQFINEGVVHADPELYRRQYAADLDGYRSHPEFAHVINEAYHQIPPPSLHANYSSNISSYGYDNYPYNYSSGAGLSSYSGRYHDSFLSSMGDRMKYCGQHSGTLLNDYPISDRVRSYSPSFTGYYNNSIHTNLNPTWGTSTSQPYSYSSSSYGCSSTSRPYPYSSLSYGYSSPYSSYHDIINRTDVTPSFDRYCGNISSYYPHSYSSSAHYPGYHRSYVDNVIRVSSENEFQNVMGTLTNGHSPRIITHC